MMKEAWHWIGVNLISHMIVIIDDIMILWLKLQCVAYTHTTKSKTSSFATKFRSAKNSTKTKDFIIVFSAPASCDET